MHDDSNPHKIILISFNMYTSLYETYCSIETEEQYLVQTRSRTKSRGIALPEVHGAKKMSDTKHITGKAKVPVTRQTGN